MRRFNWPLWAGFLLTLFAAFSYFAFFVWFPITRDFPWANLLLFLLAAVLLVSTTYNPVIVLVFPAWMVLVSVVVLIEARRPDGHPVPDKEGAV